MPFVLVWRQSHLPTPQPVDPLVSLEATEAYWQEWADRCTYEGERRDAVIRSLLTLKTLTYAPTGGIVAAVTTSLRSNWAAYAIGITRFCWLRDATITLQSLMYSGYVAADRAVPGDQGPGSLYPPQRFGRIVVLGAELPLRALPKGCAPAKEASASSSEILTSRWEGLLRRRGARKVFDDARG